MNMKLRLEARALSRATFVPLLVLMGMAAATAADAQVQKALHRGREVAAREVLVKFRGDRAAAPAPDELRWLADTDRDEEIGRQGLRRLHSRNLDVESLLAVLSQRADVEYAEPNYVVHAIGTVPNDTYFSLMWNLRNTGQTAAGGQVGYAGADIDATLAWDITTGSRANVVAVIDTGIDYRHPDLAANVWSAPSSFSVRIGSRTITCAAGTHGFNAITLTCDPLDDNSHGTHVSGTIGALGNNGRGVVGVNWVASVMGAKFLDATGSGTIADAINAIDFAIQAKQVFGAGANVRVLSNSWAGDGFSQALLDEINKANASDMLFVAAAGNVAANNDSVAIYPANYNAPNVVAVAATDNRDQLASFSNYGATTVELGAPGVAIASTVRNNGYAYYSGTSMATPHVSGAAALILSACSLDTPKLRDVILNTVDPVPALVGKTMTGGRLNVFNAIRACSAPTITSFTSNVASPYPASGFSPITWTAVAQGSAPLEYQFTRQLGAAAPVVSAWGTSSTFTWTPTTGDVGTWTVSVVVRTVGATAQATASESFALTAYTAPKITSLTADQTGTSNAGTPITWTVTSSGGIAPVQYAFYRYSAATGWVLAQSYSTLETYTWTPGVGDTGTMKVEVWAKSAGSVAAYDAWLDSVNMTIGIAPATPVIVSSLNANVASPTSVGTPITWTVTSSGGIAPVQYAFYRYSAATGWVLAQSYSTLETYTWTPGVGDTGTMKVEVWAKSAGSGAAYDAWLDSANITIGVALGTPVNVSSLIANVATPTTVGTPITWTATTTGGTPPLEYAFYRWESATGWVLVQAYSTLNTYTWTPGAPGTFVVEVWVRSAGSVAPYDAWLNGATLIVQ
jgi:subtilisin family serine protease